MGSERAISSVGVREPPSVRRRTCVREPPSVRRRTCKTLLGVMTHPPTAKTCVIASMHGVGEEGWTLRCKMRGAPTSQTNARIVTDLVDERSNLMVRENVCAVCPSTDIIDSYVAHVMENGIILVLGTV